MLYIEAVVLLLRSENRGCPVTWGVTLPRILNLSCKLQVPQHVFNGRPLT